MTALEWAFVLLAILVPLLILGIGAWVGLARERRARLEADPGPLGGLSRVWFWRLHMTRRDRIGELRFRIGDRRRQDAAEKGPRA